MAEDAYQTLKTHTKAGLISEKYSKLMTQFYLSVQEAREQRGASIEEMWPVFTDFLKLVQEQCNAPHQFEPYHERMRAPFDYYKFAIDLFSGVMDRPNSKATGLENVEQMIAQMEAGENVVLLSNHQTEVDPQMLSILLDETYPNFAGEMIFVAGGRVLTDPMATPMSMGRNLLCIYSKKHIETPPEEKADKQAYNRRTMKRMAELLTEGGKAIWVAPSGGRDRTNAEGIVEVDSFDPQAIQMFQLMAAHSKRPCHFYPLALSTYGVLPPPGDLGTDVGESRYTNGTPAFASFGKEIDIANFPGSETQDRHERRLNLANYAHNLVKTLYHQIA